MCACACGVSLCVCPDKSNTNLNVVTGSTILATGPLALHARTSAEVSSGQQLTLSLPSPIARPPTENLHISQVCSHVVHREQRVRHFSDWVLGVCVYAHVCVCYVCVVCVVCVCVCVCTCVPACMHACVFVCDKRRLLLLS